MTKLSITNVSNLRSAQKDVKKAMQKIDKVISALGKRDENFNALVWERNKCKIVDSAIEKFLKESETVCGIRKGVNGG